MHGEGAYLKNDCTFCLDKEKVCEHNFYVTILIGLIMSGKEKVAGSYEIK